MPSAAKMKNSIFSLVPLNEDGLGQSERPKTHFKKLLS